MLIINPIFKTTPIIVGLLTFIACQCGCKTQSSHVAMFGKPDEDLKYGQYTVKTYRNFDEGTGSWELCDGRNQLYWGHGSSFLVSPSSLDSIVGNVRIGDPITSPTAHNLIVVEWDGCAHGGYDISVYDLAYGPHKLGMIPHNLGGKFVDLEGNGECEFVTRDDYWSYWRGVCLAASPLPQIIFKLSDGGYHFARSLMKTNALSPSQLLQLRQEAERTFMHADDPQTSLATFYSVVLNLTYHGHLNTALAFFDSDWQVTNGPKEKEKRDFLAALSKSPYWDDVREINSGVAR